MKYLHSINEEKLKRLKEFPNEEITRFKLAEVLQVSVQNIEYWNRSGKIVKYKIEGKHSFYLKNEVYKTLKKLVKPKEDKQSYAAKVVLLED